MTNAESSVYFDTNTFDHIYKRIGGVTAADLELLKLRIKEGDVRVRFSIVNIEEVLLAVQKDAAVAFGELRLIVDLCGTQTIIKAHEVVLKQDIEAYAHGAALPSAF